MPSGRLWQWLLPDDSPLVYFATYERAVAVQARMDRWRQAWRMRQAGLTLQQAGNRLGGLSRERIRQMWWQYERRRERKLPLERYLDPDNPYLVCAPEDVRGLHAYAGAICRQLEEMRDGDG